MYHHYKKAEIYFNDSVTKGIKIARIVNQPPVFVIYCFQNVPLPVQNKKEDLL